MELLNYLARNFNLSEQEVEEFILKAPNKYKVYTIPKRTGGFRVIAQPTKELKTYQRYILKNVLPSLPIHDAAMAYKKNHSIKSNALAHVHQNYFLAMDFENFFNSITPILFWNVWDRTINISLSSKEILFYQNLFFWKPKKNSSKLILSIGAPSSPLISNFILYEFDTYITELCAKKNIKYTRYADDLSFSTNTKDNLFEIPSLVENALIKIYKGQLKINRNKTVFSSRAHNRHVTGITLTNDNKISLGRSRKRYIKHLVHKFILGKLSLSEKQYLGGLLNFSQYIEPSFISSLELKYSKDIILFLRKHTHE